MAEKDTIAKRTNRTVGGAKRKKFDLKTSFAATGKRLKSFFISMKAELKRVMWPDRKKLIQSTATVLAICLIAAVILFVVDQALAGLLNGVGFYDTAATTAATTTVTDTTATTAATTTATSAAATTAATSAAN